jgi:5'-nucleotidase
MKNKVLANLEKYVEKDERLELLLNQLRSNGRKTFLLTNSEYYYTHVSFVLFYSACLLNML